MISTTPKPPYYAVIFTSILNEEQIDYGPMAEKMIKLANDIDGFLGIESARESIGISVSYWRDMESIERWKEHSEHQFAKKMGIQKWYKSYALRISKVESQHLFKI